MNSKFVTAHFRQGFAGAGDFSMRHLFLAILLLVPIVVFGQHSHAPTKEAPPATLETGLGDINHPVSTSNPEAQKFFNQ